MTAPDVIGHRYATRAQGGQRVGHLLTHTWADDPRRGRPAVCGVRAQKWRATSLFDRSDFEDCPVCTVAAGLAPPPPPKPLATGAHGRPGRTGELPARALAVSLGQAERTLRRARFRRFPIPLVQS